MIIVEKYEKRRCGKELIWYSLVECEGIEHKGEKRRVAIKKLALRGVGTKLCRSCSHLRERNINYGKIGEKCAIYGIRRSEETLAKMRLVNAGKNNPNYGKHMSQRIKDIITQKILEKTIHLGDMI